MSVFAVGFAIPPTKVEVIVDPSGDCEPMSSMILGRRRSVQRALTTIDGVSSRSTPITYSSSYSPLVPGRMPSPVEEAKLGAPNFETTPLALIERGQPFRLF